MDLPRHAPLVVATRDARPENVHCGSIAVSDAGGRLLAWAGDPQAPVFGRSTLKPFQATPFVADGGAEHFGFGSEELALLCASHSGEARHATRVAAMLARAGLAEGALQCGCHVPMRWSAFDRTPPAGEHWSALHHNCSGKHAGFLAACRLHGWAADDYLAPAHPLQQAIRQCIADYAGLPADTLRPAIDGCGAPVYALPLAAMARAYARLASPEATPRPGTPAGAAGDFPHAATARRLFAAMTAHPELVSGEGRSDLAFMSTGSGDWVAKIGADGVQTIGIKSRGLGVAIKIGDGNMRALYVAAVETLRQLGLASTEAPLLAPFAHPEIHNARGRLTGDVRPVFQLILGETLEQRR